MDSIEKSFGARIKEIREKRALNQEQLAELVNMESRHIGRIETGKSFTTLENVEKIASALKVEVENLFSFGHKKDREVLIREINSYLNKADDEKIEFIYKLIYQCFN